MHRAWDGQEEPGYGALHASRVDPENCVICKRMLSNEEYENYRRWAAEDEPRSLAFIRLHPPVRRPRAEPS